MTHTRPYMQRQPVIEAIGSTWQDSQKQSALREPPDRARLISRAALKPWGVEWTHGSASAACTLFWSLILVVGQSRSMRQGWRLAFDVCEWRSAKDMGNSAVMSASRTEQGQNRSPYPVNAGRSCRVASGSLRQ